MPTHLKLNIKSAVIAGGAAGNHTVTGIEPGAKHYDGDTLIAVIHFDVGAAVGVDGVADLTSEFSISASDTINNTGGTDTSNGFLFILYHDADA